MLINNSPSNIFQKFLSLERYYRNCQVIIDAAGVIGLSRSLKPYGACLIFVHTSVNRSHMVDKTRSLLWEVYVSVQRRRNTFRVTAL